MNIKISKVELREIILEGISLEELNSKYDYSDITDMRHMFSGCSSLTSIPHLDTSNVQVMYGMFSNCASLTSIPLLDTSNVQDMSSMFSSCSSLEYINPYNFTLYDFNKLDNRFIKEKYPELYI